MQREDEALIRQVAQRWEQAWNAHDMTAMAPLVSEDADFVNVWGIHWQGRARIEQEHAERHRAQFRDSTWITRELRVQFLKPDVALVHLAWTLQPLREGLFTWIMLKERDKWLIRAAHNTNAAPPK
jgi:uncharacterized protein (TIGR02246 family)